MIMKRKWGQYLTMHVTRCTHSRPVNYKLGHISNAYLVFDIHFCRYSCRKVLFVLLALSQSLFLIQFSVSHCLCVSICVSHPYACTHLRTKHMHTHIRNPVVVPRRPKYRNRISLERRLRF